MATHREFRAWSSATRRARRNNDGIGVAKFCGYKIAEGAERMPVPPPFHGYALERAPIWHIVISDVQSRRLAVAQRIARAARHYAHAVESHAFIERSSPQLIDYLRSYDPIPEHPASVRAREHEEWRLKARLGLRSDMARLRMAELAIKCDVACRDAVAAWRAAA